MEILKSIVLRLETINMITYTGNEKQCSLYDIAIMKQEERYYLSWHEDINGINYIHFYLSRQSNLGLEYINDELTTEQFNYIRTYYYHFINK